MRRHSISVVAAFAAALVLLLAGCGEGTRPYTGPALPYTPEPTRAREPNPRVALETSAGRIELELFEDDTPNTVNNFINLIEKKFYDGTKFHRLIKDFMIQGGDPQGTGRGGPGYRFPDEIKPKTNKITKYALAMANSGPSTNGSQFFIMTGDRPRPDLEKKHTVFGEVVAGTDVVDKLNGMPVEGEKPKEEIKLLKAEVLNKRSHEYKPWNTMPDQPGMMPSLKTPSKTFPMSPRPPAKPGERKAGEAMPVMPPPLVPVPPPAPNPPVPPQPPLTPPEKKAEEKKPEEKKAEDTKAEEKKTEEKK